MAEITAAGDRALALQGDFNSQAGLDALVPKTVSDLGDGSRKASGVPQDVANLAVFFACDTSAFMTGTNIDINGGVLFS